LTYTLDNEVIEKLSEVSSGTKLILHDFKQGISLEDNSNSTIVCVPMKPLKPNDKNCFHSKLALLKSESGAKFIVGSANLSVDSFATEKEIAIEMELEFKTDTDVFIYNQILNFFEQLNSQLLIQSSIWEQTISKLRFKELPIKQNEIHFVFNSKEKSIFDELKNYFAKHRSGQRAKSIKVATPFVSDEYSKIEEVKSITENISIYLRTGAKIKPFQNYHFKIFQPSNKKREGFHSKLLLIEFNSDAVLFIGSANFTEQGFFNTLNESANQECGIILKVSLQEMQEWFSESYWKQLSEIEISNYTESEDNSLEFFASQNTHYAWAEKEKSVITTYIFNPNNSPVSKTKGGNKIKLQNTDSEFLFKTNEIQEQNQTVTFFIGDNKISVSVFELNEYIAGLNQKGESIFDWFKGIYSVNPVELDTAINEGKLSIQETTNIRITEPPKLEQYFYNVKNLMQSIKHKKYFTDFNESEIQKEINKTDDGRTLYLSLQLLKAFNTKPNTENIKQVCRKRISELANKLNINEKTLNTFIKGWLTSKN
uniref:phospholipase D-like domain-containing protein n=1 Tax=Flavobacterium filum TaxID=370974 RepID=UPI0023F14544